MKLLEKYLNDHLSGSAAALSLLRTLADSDSRESVFYLKLRDDIAENRKILTQMMRAAGFQRRHWLEHFAALTSAAGQLRLRWQGLSAGHLGLVEALEILELGIQGQLLLWRCLKETGPALGLWDDVDFAGLIASAETQRNQVETRRLTAAKRAFSTGADEA